MSRDTGRFVRETPGSQSLERGLALLRAFRAGGPVLTNAELAERVGLPRPTVSRLTRSLVDSGFLAFDIETGGYRLTPVFLSIARAYREGALALDLALPLMKKTAQRQGVNVGLAVADQCEVVYLESVRESRRGVFRRIEPGSRTPIELTSLGRACLYALDAAARQEVLARIASRYGAGWPAVHDQITQAFSALAAKGYCTATWQAGMVSIATPLQAPDRSIYSLNVSFPSADARSVDAQVATYAPMLLRLAADIRGAWSARWSVRVGAG